MIVTTRNRYPAYPGSFFAGNHFDRAFGRLAALSAPSRAQFGPSVKGGWVDAGYELTVDLPGVPEHAIGVSVAGRTLSIEVSTDALSWSRQVRLPQSLDPEQVSARYVDGRLTVVVAKTAAAESRVITIDTTPAQPAIEAAEGDADQGASGEGTSVTE
jgi:HSP20 family molecular chaperone IbpA